MISKIFKYDDNHGARSSWLLLIAILCCCLFFEIFRDSLNSILRYQSDWSETGEYWRVITGHFVHLGMAHFLLNALGLIAIWLMYGQVYSHKGWVIFIIICCMGMSLGFTFFDSSLEWYVGLSGLLHGLVYFALTPVLYKNYKEGHLFKKFEDITIAVIFGVKVIYEKTIGAVPFTSSSSGGEVVVNAHFYGTLIGIMLGTIYLVSTINSQKRI